MPRLIRGSARAIIIIDEKQDSYYFVCCAKENLEQQNLEKYEADEGLIDTVFWNVAAPGVPTEGIKDFLEYLRCQDIRTGVISNIAYDSSVVAERINRLLPENAFEFIITSSNFMFRKPNKRIFDLALEKAELQPVNGM